MTFSPTTHFLSEVESGDPIPRGKLAYLQERQRNRIYHFIVTKFLELERDGKLTRAELARRILRRPEQVTRLLGAPGNWTLDTLSDLLVGIAGEELEPHSLSLFNRPARNFNGPDWIQRTEERNLRIQAGGIVDEGKSGTKPPPATSYTVIHG